MKTMGEIIKDFKIIYGHRIENLKDDEKKEKGIKNKIFHQIIIELFEKYGRDLGYRDYTLSRGN